MIRKVEGLRPLLLATTACLLSLCATTSFGQVQASYQYNLSSFAGRLRYDWVRVHVDRQREEIYVLYQNIVRIFSPTGMEIFSFGDDLDLGHILDAAVDANGDIILLSYKESRPMVTRCNFRGAPTGAIEIANLPEGLVFHANRVVLRNGLLYFASLATSTVVVTDSNGQYQKHFEFLSLMSPEDRPKGEGEMAGFTVDPEGNIYFTIAAVFKVFKFSTDGQMTSFGRSGSPPGRFGILAGIAIDSKGNLLVADKLKCVVMVFDKAFNFLGEFGYRGARPENLIIPDDIAIDAKDRIYVSQGRRRGVSVFALNY